MQTIKKLGGKRMEFFANEGKNVEIEVGRKHLFTTCHQNKICETRRILY